MKLLSKKGLCDVYYLVFNYLQMYLLIYGFSKQLLVLDIMYV
jgi:hypothetical protein